MHACRSTLEDPTDAALCWFVLAAVHYYTGLPDDAWAEVNRYREARDNGGSAFRAAHAAGIVATIATISDPPSAAGHARRAARIGARLGNPSLDAWLAHIAGLAASAVGDHAAARELYRRAVMLGDHGVNPLAYTQALLAMTMRAPPAERSRAYRETIQRLQAAHHAADMWVVLESLAAHWAASGDLEPAAVVFGHLEARSYRFESTAPRRQRALTAIRANQSSPDWLAHGADLDSAAIVAYTLRVLDERT